MNFAGDAKMAVGENQKEELVQSRPLGNQFLGIIPVTSTFPHLLG
jgi:hypothetical protein